MPNRAMKPTPAEMENGMPRIQRARMPPVVAIGTFKKINSANLPDLNVMYSNEPIKNSASGTATVNRPVASCRFLKLPPQAMR